MADLLTEMVFEGDLVSKMLDLLTELVFESDLVSKRAVLLTERVFESDLVSKMPDLLTELVFESDLVSKMADLLTKKGFRRARCAFMRHNMNALNGPEVAARERERAARAEDGSNQGGAKLRGAKCRSNPSGSKTRRGRRLQQGAVARREGPKTQQGGLVRVAAEPFRPASDPSALLYRILCPGARPSRHSRGNVS